MSSPRPAKLRRVVAPSEVAPTDAELVSAVAAGDLAALGALYDRYQVDMRRFFLRMTPGAHDVDDLVQETFLRLLHAAKLYDGRPSARPFLIGIGSMVLRSRRRSWRRFGEVLRSLGVGLQSVSTPTPEHEARNSEDRSQIDAALAKLSHPKREAFLMIEAEGLSGEEVASALGIPVATVWTRLHHARKELRKSLGRWRAQ